MREIKFRYWNSVSKMMVNDPVLPAKEWTLEQYFSDRGWVWMQFTGLKDKNGKEIYEGDVVTCDEPLGIGRLFRNIQGEIVYLDNVASFGVEVSTGKQEVSEMTSYSWEVGHFRNYEVIGNIYENPDLLQ